jgi:regulation of enolase protein 1 (concanavalin A-like superfamily)
MDVMALMEPGRPPDGFSWLNEPESWEFSAGRLRMNPAAHTDLFRPPDGSEARDNGCLLFTRVSGDFSAVVHLRAGLVGFGDAGAITVRDSPVSWAKLCMERSPVGDVSIVSVVTRGVSDDSNGELLGTPECWLRITRKERVFGMHHSIDGSAWRFARTFTIDTGDPVMVGIQAQAPYGGGCWVEFDHFTISPETVDDFRSGE